MIERDGRTGAAAAAQAKIQAAVRAYQGGDADEALALARTALQVRAQPATPASWSPADRALVVTAQSLIGTILAKQGARIGAAEAYRAAADAGAAQAPSLWKLAATLFCQAGQPQRVVGFARKALQANPGDGAFAFLLLQAVANLLPSSLEQQDEAETAVLVADLVANLDRRDAAALYFAAQVLRNRGDYPALASLLAVARAGHGGNVALTALDFQYAHDLADLATIARHQQRLAPPRDDFAEQLLGAEQALARLVWCEDEALLAAPTLEHRQLAASFAERPARRSLDAGGRRLHIGYLSSDFTAHATMTLFLDSLLQHDRERFQISLFCHTDPGARARNPLPQALQPDLVVLDGLDDRAAAAEIDRRGVDILVDLKGHTPGARLAIVNLSRAPVKATYLGFPGPVGGVDLDYAIVDPIVAPPTAQAFYQESFCSLPECYQANSASSRPRPSGMARRADHGLPEGRFVFASFNGVHKITPGTLALWAQVLRSVPDSLFWLLADADLQRRNLRDAFAAEGIGTERLVFAGRLDYGRHVQRLVLADLALDTFPYNGHTTTSDLLWCGLPVLTRKGGCFAARVSESLLAAAGLPELVATDGDDFVARAVALARQPEVLAALRQRLVEGRATAPLFDTARFTRHLEQAYLLMAERARSGLAPAPITVPASVPPEARWQERPGVSGA